MELSSLRRTNCVVRLVTKQRTTAMSVGFLEASMGVTAPDDVCVGVFLWVAE
jgi:hypothetical protein